MGERSGIQWTRHTFNPWRGCTHVSPGCTNCYAEQLAKRNPATLGTWGASGTRAIAAESYWHQPVRWDRAAAAAGERHRVFCASLADVFEDRPDLVAPRQRLLRLIEQTPNLDWLLLTKRPEKVWPLLETYLYLEGWPPNAWLGFTAEDQRRLDERFLAVSDTFRDLAATYRPAKLFVSAEPLLGPLDLIGSDEQTSTLHAYEDDVKVDWVIVGGESGAQARPFDLAWARSIVDQCRGAGVPVFVKQLGRRPCTGLEGRQLAEHVPLRHSHGGDIDEWPEDLRVREFPTPAAAA